MERLAQGKRSGTLGWVVVSKTIYALKGQKRKNIKAWLNLEIIQN